MTTPQEIELKLALSPAQAAAFVKRMGRRRSVPLEQDLVTRYFDTPDFALSAAGVALRVRRAGRRWVQTLKTEGERSGGLSRRVEFEMPVARGALDWTRFPEAALAYVPEALREQVVPVFETRFHRTAWLVKGRGGAEIEVALDVGEVATGTRSQPICEVELELKSGNPDALFALALEWAAAFDCLPFDVSKAERGVRLAHGAVDEPVKAAPVGLGEGMSVEEGFAAIVQACLAQFQANLPGVLGVPPQAGEGAKVMPTPGPLPNPLPHAGEHPEGHKGANVMPTPIDEYLHQARVALRRLRAAQRLYRKVCVLPDELADSLAALAAALGPARDWDVLLAETLPEIAPHYPDQAAWQAGVEALEARRVEVRQAMRAALGEAHPGAWLLAMQRWLLERGWRLSPSGGEVPEAQRSVQLSPLDKWARRALEKGHRRVERGARSFAKLKPDARHALRIAIKRQRYATEFFQALLAGHPRRLARYLAVLHAAQDCLGRANDARVASALLAGTRLEPGQTGDFARGWLAARQADAGGGCAAHMKKFLKLKPCW